jgi:protein TonB
MNITRYKWPVIIAAGLHGALFVSFPSESLRGRPIADERPLLPPIPSVPADLTPPQDEETGAVASGAPVASLPEMPPRPDISAPFEIPPISRTAPERPVSTLEDYTGGVGDGIFGPGNMKVPSIATAANLDRPPLTVARATPRYPASLRTDGIAGEATVEFVVGTDGRVLSAEAVKWTHREFASAAVDAVLRWKFEPGTVNGRKVRFRMVIPIQFSVGRE